MSSPPKCSLCSITLSGKSKELLKHYIDDCAVLQQFWKKNELAKGEPKLSIECPFCLNKVGHHNLKSHILDKCPKNGMTKPLKIKLPGGRISKVYLPSEISTYHPGFEDGPDDIIPSIDGTRISIVICEYCGNRFSSEAYKEHIVREHHQVDGKVSWGILNPSREYQVDDLVTHFKRLQGMKSKRIIQWERLEKLDSLNPKTVYVGTNEFSGYVVFVFSNTEKVILECPMPGNATYLINGNWRELTKKSKTDLLDGHGKSAERVIHRGDTWFQNVKAKLLAK